MRSEEQLNALIDSIYEAAVNPSHWDTVLKEIAASFNGVGALIGYRDIANENGGVPAAYNLDTEVLSSYESHYHAQDVWASNALRFKTGSILTSDDLVDRSLLIGSEVYNDYLQAMDIHDLLAVSLANDERSIGFLSIYRSAKMENFQREEIRKMQLLTRHLQRAAKISTKLSQLHSASRLTEQTLDKIVHPIIVVDRERNIQSANYAAERLLMKADGLIAQAGKLGARRQQDTRAIEDSIADVLGATINFHNTANSIAITRYPSRDRYGLTFIPISYEATKDVLGLKSDNKPAVSIWVSVPNPALAINAEVFGRQYELTTSEICILGLLVQGHTTQEAADLLQLSKETIRTHLKSIFHKTGTNRQSQLVSKTIRSAPPVTTHY